LNLCNVTGGYFCSIVGALITVSEKGVSVDKLLSLEIICPTFGVTDTLKPNYVCSYPLLQEIFKFALLLFWLELFVVLAYLFF
jgi:hypothetical protein